MKESITSRSYNSMLACKWWRANVNEHKRKTRYSLFFVLYCEIGNLFPCPEDGCHADVLQQSMHFYMLELKD